MQTDNEEFKWDATRREISYEKPEWEVSAFIMVPHCHRYGSGCGMVRLTSMYVEQPWRPNLRMRKGAAASYQRTLISHQSIPGHDNRGDIWLPQNEADSQQSYWYAIISSSCTAELGDAEVTLYHVTTYTSSILVYISIPERHRSLVTLARLD